VRRGRHRVRRSSPVAAGRSGWSVDLNDPFSAFKKECCEARAVASRALDRPNPPSRRIAVREGKHAFVSEGVGRALGIPERGTRFRVNDGRGVGVAVSVDADDEIGFICEH
jgi:hypothetical protein